MEKDACIRRFGKVTYEKRLRQSRDWKRKYSEEVNAKTKGWRESNPEKVAALDHEKSRKGGKHYEHKIRYMMNGIPHEKDLVRFKHRHRYAPYKKIIAPETQIHHEWIPGTADFRGVALVEANSHQYGFIDVIQILEGEITLLTEEGIRQNDY